MEIKLDLKEELKNFSNKDNQYTIPIFIPHKGCPNNCIFCNQRKISGQIDDVTVEDTIIPENIISCKVIKSISNDKAIIDFNGYGLIVSFNEKADVVNVKYTGDIGTPDFKYEVV